MAAKAAAVKELAALKGLAAAAKAARAPTRAPATGADRQDAE
jgi:hypothetical protein